VGNDFLTTEVLQDLIKNPSPEVVQALGATEAERTDKVLKGGIKIYTTFDRHLQDLAVDASNTAKPFGGDFVASVVSIDPSSGAVKAMVSGQDYALSQTNFATSPDGRQTGSTFKVITLATALANGYSPNDIVNGSSPCSVPGFEGFTVNDEEGGGNLPLWDATAGSVNCAFVRLATSVGEGKVIDMAHKMGVTKTNLQAFLTLTLGVFEQNTETMADVMATIASGGIHHTPYVVQKIVSTDGRVLLDMNNPGDRVLEADVAACEQNMLRHVVVGPENHTGENAKVEGHDVFGKTGTTDERNDAWFIGATPQLATAVWFGNWRTTKSGIQAGFGGDSAAPVFRAFMTGALADLPNIPLPAPGPVCERASQNVIDTGGRTDNAAPGPFTPGPVTPQLPTVQQLPTTPTAAAAPAPTAPAVAPQTRGNGNGNGNGNGQ
jgi:penicillin-binding protein 1A